MPVSYNTTCINARLNAVVAQVDGGGASGSLKLMAGALVVSTITLSFPCGTVAGGVLTLAGVPLTDPSAAGSGTVTTARVEDSNGVTVISGFTVGALPGTADIIISGGLDIGGGDIVSVLSGTITGS